jgi:diguanylate cyclase (GGDEF)-like protein/PAS domain S-box-containing protein
MGKSDSGVLSTLMPKLEKAVVLLGDGVQNVRQKMSQALETIGLTVLEAVDGPAVVEQVERALPDVILLDSDLPAQDGFAVCAQLRNLPNVCHLPIILITAFEDHLAIHHAYEVGATDVITRPVNHELMCHRVLQSLRSVYAMKSLTQCEAMLAEAEKITRLGSWEWHLKTNTLWLSDAIYRILDCQAHTRLHALEEFVDFAHPDDRDTVNLSIHRSLQEKIALNVEYRIVRPDGSWRYVQQLGNFSPDTTAEDPVRLFGTMQDITERKMTEERLSLLNEAISCLPIGITIADADGRIMYTNPAEARMHGYETDELMNREVNRLAPHKLSKPLSQGKLQTLGVWKRESINVRKSGENFPVQLSSIAVRNKKGLPIGVVTACEDISDRKEAEAKIHRLAYYDPLTDLPNRMLFNDRMSYMLAQATRYKRKGALLFLDVDRFKAINDSLGHAMGDLLLKILAERLTDAIRHTDIITRQEKSDLAENLARFGGDEFIIWLAEIEESQDVIKVAERILETFEKPFSLDKHDVRVTASMGIAIFPGDGRNREALFKNADAAMYHAKAKGGDNYQFYSNSMNSAALTMLTMESALQKAIGKEELLLYYQPQIDLRSGKIAGAEALLRWQREGESLLSPKQFIPLAEKSGLIVQIGEWVLRKVCMQCKEWQTSGLPPLRFSVNLSSRQFWQKQLALTVSSMLEEYDLDPSCLGLEITENILLKEEDSTIDALNSLKKLGVHLLIDDFGTGYSSLNYLKRFPLDYLKIDRCFIKELDNSPEDVAIVSAIIAMANSLNLKVIAEGIETYSQLNFLRERCCDEIQGFLVSEPLPPEKFVQFVEQGGGIFPQVPNLIPSFQGRTKLTH